jgi:hypothetical protein
MIVVMKRGATEEMVKRMARRVEELGLKAHVIVGTDRTVIAAIGKKPEGAQEMLASCEEVAAPARSRAKSKSCSPRRPSKRPGRAACAAARSSRARVRIRSRE